MELIVIYSLNQTNINQRTLSFRNSWTYVSRSFQTPHFTMWNGNIHLFHKIVILGVVSWNLQNLKRGVCFCQDFVWCLCKKGNCQLFFNDWKGGPTSPRLQEPPPPLGFLHHFSHLKVKKIRKEDKKNLHFLIKRKFL